MLVQRITRYAAYADVRADAADDDYAFCQAFRHFDAATRR